MDAPIHSRHGSLHICRVGLEVCCTCKPYFAGERFNIFSHLAAFVGFVCWAIINQTLAHEGTIATLQSIFLVSLAMVFGVSTLYHMCNAREEVSRWLRVADYLCIYAAMSVQSIFLMYLIAEAYPERHVPWQSIADPIIAMGLVTIMTVGREMDVLLTGVDTYVKIGPCDPCRYAHVDGKHAVMRIGINLLFVGQWILYTCAIYDSVAHPYNILLIGTMTLSTALIVLTQANDYYDLSGSCSEWLPFPHGIFHVAAIVCAVLIAGVNEVVLSVR